jgi:hypothetical protein
LLLDINNVFVSAKNHCTQPLPYLESFPLNQVKEIHLGGHDEETDDAGAPLPTKLQADAGQTSKAAVSIEDQASDDEPDDDIHGALLLNCQCPRRMSVFVDTVRAAPYR